MFQERTERRIIRHEEEVYRPIIDDGPNLAFAQAGELAGQCFRVFVVAFVVGGLFLCWRWIDVGRPPAGATTFATFAIVILASVAPVAIEALRHESAQRLKHGARLAQLEAAHLSAQAQRERRAFAYERTLSERVAISASGPVAGVDPGWQSDMLRFAAAVLQRGEPASWRAWEGRELPSGKCTRERWGKLTAELVAVGALRAPQTNGQGYQPVMQFQQAIPLLAERHSIPDDVRS